MPRVDQRALHAAADAHSKARRVHEAAKRTAEAAYERLRASPDTIEYRIDWNVARRAEAAAAWRVRQTEESYRTAGGYVAGEDE